MKIPFELRHDFRTSIIYGTVYEPDMMTSLVLFIHDINEHRFRYEALADYFNSFHVGFVSFDLRGHHRSLDHYTKGHFDDKQGYQVLLKDCLTVVEKIKQEYPFMRLTIMGCGIGGHCAQILFNQFPDYFYKLILVSPYQKPANFLFKKAWMKLKSTKIPRGFSERYLNWFVKTPKHAPALLKYRFLAAREEIVRDYIHDPFCGFRLTNRAVYDVLTIIESALQVDNKTNQSDQEIIIIAGLLDPIGRHGEVAQYLKQHYLNNGYHRTSLFLIENCAHDILIEARHDYYLASLLERVIKSL